MSGLALALQKLPRHGRERNLYIVRFLDSSGPFRQTREVLPLESPHALLFHRTSVASPSVDALDRGR
jgi:hypothetical protein